MSHDPQLKIRNICLNLCLSIQKCPHPLVQNTGHEKPWKSAFRWSQTAFSRAAILMWFSSEIMRGNPSLPAHLCNLLCAYSERHQLSIPVQQQFQVDGCQKEKFIQIQIISAQEGWWKMHVNYVWSVASPTYRIPPRKKTLLPHFRWFILLSLTSRK